MILSLLLPLFSLAEPNFQFRYEPNEGEGAASCIHEQIRDLPDWEVTCGQGVWKRKFVAHVIVRNYERKDSSTLEILYWVTERALDGKTPPKFHSTTGLLKFAPGSSPMGMTLSQGVENDYASLVMEWKP